MFGRSRSWVGQGKAKNIHSLDHLKYMYHVLTKNTTVTDHNRNLLVETIRSITEILIWGDQNDSSVFDFFLEKNMFAFFLNILRQKSGRYVCVQLLQTLNILFENISHETSLYYLLSNNHVNSIIVHKFDFSDEEIMAYYISFLKTLSLKLNNHTVHFFYNEHTNDFALYTEAIKFFNHPESMVRIAVRTITLNVYKVDNQHMLHYIRDKTAVPYFSNLVWFIGSHVIELDKCVQTDEEHKNRGKLSDLVAEHLDHLHYLNDILIINCEFLNDVLTDHLLNRLFLPLYVYSLVGQEQSEDRKITPQVSLYLLSQVFLIIHYQPLVNALADVILNGDLSVFSSQAEHNAHKTLANPAVRRFAKPSESLERSLEMSRQKGRKRTQKRPNYKNVGEEEEEERGGGAEEGPAEEKAKGTEASSKGSRTIGDTEEIEMVVMEKCKISDVSTLTEQNITDEEKSAARAEGQQSRPFLDMVYNALDCTEDDYHALFVLCLLYAMSHSKGINPALLEKIQLPAPDQDRTSYSQVLVERLIRVMNQAAQPDGKIRLATLELGCLLLKQSVLSGSQCIIKDVHLACLEGAREESLHLLRRFYKAKEIFLDMFEDEYRSMTAIRVFFMLRSLSLQLQTEPETQLPLTRPEDLIKTDDVLDLNNSDLIACMVVSKDGVQAQRFLAVDIYQMSLVEPETKRLGWGVVKFAGLLQDMQVSGVEDDSRALNIIIHKPTSNPHAKPMPILQANFIFADHIRCIIAKQRLAKGRIQARRMKMQRIAALLDLPVQPSSEVLGFGQSAAASSQLPFRFYDQSRRGPADSNAQRSVFDKVPGFAVAHSASQHSPSPLFPPPPAAAAALASATQSPPAPPPQSGLAGEAGDEAALAERTPPPSSCVGEGGGGGECAELALAQTLTATAPLPAPIPALALAPSLTPAAQPTISLLSDPNTDALSADSLTLLPPADPPRLRNFSTQGDAPLMMPTVPLPDPSEEDPEPQTEEEEEEEEEEASAQDAADEDSAESGQLELEGSPTLGTNPEESTPQAQGQSLETVPEAEADQEQSEGPDPESTEAETAADGAGDEPE
ncbi:hypothetical protein AALO_G00077460 [Alosa alosa]|uniref:Protein CLEC16A n=1 Tax=Alosa alosa TaxID=278164 RepID=A0AAV6H049_9TELE|nr:hypothetical protein AALO_G00077460 [Alosa alosa]